MDVFEAIKTRRSIRRFEKKAVEDAKLLKVLEAARLAPSAANRQPWGFIVVKDSDIKKKLRSAYNANWFVSAPIIIVACAFPQRAWIRKDGEEYWKIDIAIAMQNLILEAWEQGLGTCWIGDFDETEAKTILGIPKNIRIVAMTPLGYPSIQKSSVTDRKPLEKIICYDHW